MEKFERLFRLYKINYRIKDGVDEKFVVSDNTFIKNTFIKFTFLFIKNQDNDINDIEYLLSSVYKHIKNYQKNK